MVIFNSYVKLPEGTIPGLVAHEYNGIFFGLGSMLCHMNSIPKVGVKIVICPEQNSAPLEWGFVFDEDFFETFWWLSILFAIIIPLEFE